ncbi:glycosyltransferase family A protein [Flavobacterium sp. J27]|uniref:glycosyltransferase family A protein n=1 Tax=Flavobacterium sp. J27 TaxID=2060419 RepID=UPI00102F9170|nr:glycosyltransferase family A protein [Flavobacterium sp. J27]
MLNDPLVTVICTSYNHALYVERSLNSVINQDYKNIELIIVDNASQDNSVAVIENWLQKYPSTLFLKNTINIGNNKSFNQAVALSKGNYLIDLAADDVLTKEGITNQIHTFLNNPNAGLVFGNAKIIDEDDLLLHYHFPVNTNLKVKDTSIFNTNYESILKGGNCMCSVSGMYKRMVFEELNGYDENLAYEDLDYWLRVARKHNLIYIDLPLVEKRFLTNSQLSHFYKKSVYEKRINYSTFMILKKAFGMNTKTSEYNALLKRIHHELIHNFKLRNISLVFKLIILKVKTEYKIRVMN